MFVRLFAGLLVSLFDVRSCLLRFICSFRSFVRSFVLSFVRPTFVHTFACLLLVCFLVCLFDDLLAFGVFFLHLLFVCVVEKGTLNL